MLSFSDSMGLVKSRTKSKAGIGREACKALACVRNARHLSSAPNAYCKQSAGKLLEVLSFQSSDSACRKFTGGNSAGIRLDQRHACLTPFASKSGAHLLSDTNLRKDKHEELGYEDGLCDPMRYQPNFPARLQSPANSKTQQ